MKSKNKPAALILLSTQCPHCHTLEALLRQRSTNGLLGELKVINLQQAPEVARHYGVLSVPWLQLGHFIFDESLTPKELDRWIEYINQGTGHTEYISYLLERGKLLKAIEWIEKGNTTLKAVIPLLADPDAKINVRVGIGAILEHFEDTQTIGAIIPDLLHLLHDSHQAIRTDACHYLSLTHSSAAIEPLKPMLDDEDQQVRQVARESIDALMETAGKANQANTGKP